jgi:hypothetical protein
MAVSNAVVLSFEMAASSAQLGYQRHDDEAHSVTNDVSDNIREQVCACPGPFAGSRCSPEGGGRAMRNRPMSLQHSPIYWAFK